MNTFVAVTLEAIEFFISWIKNKKFKISHLAPCYATNSPQSRISHLTRLNLVFRPKSGFKKCWDMTGFGFQNKTGLQLRDSLKRFSLNEVLLVVVRIPAVHLNLFSSTKIHEWGCFQNFQYFQLIEAADILSYALNMHNPTKIQLKTQINLLENRNIRNRVK